MVRCGALAGSGFACHDVVDLVPGRHRSFRDRRRHCGAVNHRRAYRNPGTRGNGGGMGGLAVWAGSEAVLPAYIIGMILAGTVGKDHILVRRLRTLTFGLMTPFY